MSQRKVFEASIDPTQEPIGFTFAFRDVNTGAIVRSEDFDALPNPGMGGMLNFTKLVTVVGGKEQPNLGEVGGFFERVLVGDGYERWEGLMADKTITVSDEQVAGALRFLMEEWSARPTVRPLPSSGGPLPSGLPSTAQPLPVG